jgi:hypothetical protein
MADANMKILREASGIRPGEIRANASTMTVAALKIKTKAVIAPTAVLRVGETSRKAAVVKTTLVRKIKLKAAITAARIARPAGVDSGKITAVLKIKIRAAIIAVKAVPRVRNQTIVDAMSKNVLKAETKTIAVKAARVARLLRKIANAMSADDSRANTKEITAAKAAPEGKAQIITAMSRAVLKVKMKIIAVKVARVVRPLPKIAAKVIGKIKAIAVREVPRRFMAIRKMATAVALRRMINTKIKIGGRGADRSRASLNIRAAMNAASRMKMMNLPVHVLIASRNMLIVAGK